MIDSAGTFLLNLGSLPVTALLAVLLLLLEALFPLFPSRGPVASRWFANTTIYLTSLLLLWLVRLALAWLALDVAAALDFGLFHQWLAPAWLQLVVTVIVLDLLQYAVHRVMHRVPLLWRVHRVHHSDPEVDVSTSLRHHPLEMLLLAGAQALGVLALACTPQVYMIAFALQAFWSFWQHVNLALPDRLDRFLQILVVTPGMHRLHHSASRRETDSNYGLILSAWDRVFRSFRQRSRPELFALRLGLDRFSDQSQHGISGLLRQPFH